MGHDLNNRLAALTPDKIKLLIRKTAKKRNTPVFGGVKRQPRDGKPFPLSYAQERLWFLCQLAPESTAYNNPLAVRAAASSFFDPGITERSLNEIVRRHEILRTTFHRIDGQPYQVIAPALQLKVAYRDLRAIPGDRREAEAKKIAVLEGRQPFDLEKGSLLRFKILHLEDNEYILLITFHHLISDGWSNGVFTNEMAVLSDAFSRGMPSPLPELAVQYADYAVWERENLQGERLNRLLSYWKRQLGGEIPHLRLPIDRPRPAILDFSGGIETLMLPGELTDQLKALGRREGTTLFQVLLAAFKVLLYRYTGQEDILVGSPAANRNRMEIQGLLGLFMNTIVFRTSAADHPTFREFLLRVRNVCQQGFAHQELPFGKLVEELQPPRDLRSHPFFQVMFAYQNVPELPGTTLRPFKVDYGTSKFDLDLWMEETGNDILLTMFYYKDLFDGDTIKRMLNHFMTLLAAICADPDRRISHLPLMSDSERAYILGLLNRTGKSLDQGECILHRFELQAAASPDIAAVESPGNRLTYAGLNGRANRLARYLRRYGVGPEVVVGLLTDRTVSMIIGLLGILKAGGAYVPLDPALPQERLSYILEDSRAFILVTGERFRPAIPSMGIKTIYLDTDWPDIAPGDAGNIKIPVKGNHLVYVIYTSGTTGKPKGVSLEHRQLLHYVDAIWAEMALHDGARFAAVSTLAADLGNTAIFPALCSGGCIVIVPHEMASSPNRLASYFERNPIDCIKIVPSHLSALLDSSRAKHILPRKLLILGGEASSHTLVDRIRVLAPGCRVLNHYGPTEATIGVLTYQVPLAGDSPRTAHLPLGRPLARTQVYVLDRYLQPVPAGVTGELHIGGEGLARGYLNRPELTARKFVDYRSYRTYKTGDLARWLPDGNIEFLGRMDRQVKIRGFRTELGEIEAVLAKHPEVDQAIVDMPEAHDPKHRLLAYVVLKKARSTTQEELMGFLKAKLPDYMVPNTVVFLHVIPITPNGKVDYGALPTGPAARPEQDHITPRDTVELELGKMWESILEVESVGINDNFFELGGHSLLAVRLMTRIEEVFGVELPLGILFTYGTIEHLARVIRENPHPVDQSLLAAIQPGGSRPPLFFVHPAGGNVLCYYDLARCLGNDQPFYGLQASSFRGPAAIHTGIRDIAGDYLKAVTGAAPRGPYLLGGWSMGAVVAFEMAQQLVKQGQDVPLLAILDQPAPGTRESSAAEARIDDAMNLVDFARKVEQLSGKKLALSYEELCDRDPAEQARLFLERFKVNKLVPPDTKTADFQGFLEMQKAHNLATSRYVPEMYPGTVVLFRGQEPLPMANGLEAPPGTGNRQDPTLGWQHCVSQPIEIQPVPGNHITMMAQPHVQVLAEKLKNRIEYACIKGTGGEE